MNFRTTLAAVAALGLATAAGSAQAAIFISLTGGASTQAFFANDQVQNTYSAVCGAVCGGFDEITISTNPAIDPVLLHADTIEANASGVANRDIFVVRTDANNLNFAALASGFSGTFGSGQGYAAFSVRYRTYIDTSNGTSGAGIYNAGTLLADRTVSGLGGNFNPLAYGETVFSAFDTSTLSGPYSIVGRFTIQTAGLASLQPDLIVNGLAPTVVPEPATWALMISGFGAAGAMLRRRRALSVPA